MKTILEMNIEDMLKHMDIPKERIDISKPDNLEWLIRNVGIRNNRHSMYPTMMSMLTQLIKDRRKG